MQKKPILATDVGSLPFENDLNKFLECRKVLLESWSRKSAHYFEKIVVDAFLDKAKNIDLPTYPQFADMNEMFLELFDGVEKVIGKYELRDIPRLSKRSYPLPEVEAIRRNLKSIAEKIGKKVSLKLCITGPYTLSYSFLYSKMIDPTLLSEPLNEILDKVMFREKYGEVAFVSVDEPMVGVVDDPNLDLGNPYRETLLGAWERIFHKIKCKGAGTGMHLHSTLNEIFWGVGSLDVIESSIGDPIYTSREPLVKADKFLCVSICKTDPDELILQRIKDSSRLGEIWKRIKEGRIAPEQFLEDKETMKSRLKKVIENVGVERILYASPECGLRGLFSYKCAIEYLKRVGAAVEEVNLEISKNKAR